MQHIFELIDQKFHLSKDTTLPLNVDQLPDCLQMTRFQFGKSVNRSLRSSFLANSVEKLRLGLEFHLPQLNAYNAYSVLAESLYGRPAIAIGFALA